MLRLLQADDLSEEIGSTIKSSCSPKRCLDTTVITVGHRSPRMKKTFALRRIRHGMALATEKKEHRSNTLASTGSVTYASSNMETTKTPMESSTPKFGKQGNTHVLTVSKSAAAKHASDKNKSRITRTRIFWSYLTAKHRTRSSMATPKTRNLLRKWCIIRLSERLRAAEVWQDRKPRLETSSSHQACRTPNGHPTPTNWRRSEISRDSKNKNRHLN